MDVHTDNADLADIEALRALLVATQTRLVEAEERLARECAARSADQTLIAHLRLAIARFRHEKYGQRSERKARLLEQLELQLEELEANVSEDDLAAEEVSAWAGASKSGLTSAASR
jgi:transposase